MKPLSQSVICLSVFAVVVFNLKTALASRGNTDIVFRNCVGKCQFNDCDEEREKYTENSIYLHLMGWNCIEECNYRCMWITVARFQEIPEKGIPQFFGKWPFIRMLGIQEPASVVASLLNLGAHSQGLRKLRSRVPRDAPLFWFWHIFSFVCINGWIWSTIFHTKDSYWTELMDYFCAFSMVVFSFFSGIVRIFGQVKRLEVLLIGGVVAALYSYHVQYLLRGNFDYGYNMKANITIGILNAAIWLVWCGRNRSTHPHVWKCALAIVLAVASIVLEVNDFAPIFWILDAHALFHFATGFGTPLWYSFLLDDCQFLASNKVKLL